MDWADFLRQVGIAVVAISGTAIMLLGILFLVPMMANRAALRRRRAREAAFNQRYHAPQWPPAQSCPPAAAAAPAPLRQRATVRHAAPAAAAAPAPVAGVAIRRHAPVRVRVRRPLWAEKAWRLEAGAYVGEYQAAGRKFSGRIETPYQGAYTAYIYRPPMYALDGHEHRPCFRQNGRGPDWWNIHFSAMPASVDHAITTIEAVLADALLRQKG